MADQQSLSVRGFKLASILDKKHGELEMVLKVMDLENELAAAREEVREIKEQTESISWSRTPSVVELEEFADNAAWLTNPPDEKTWIEALCHKTGLDVRAILSPLPKELGPETFRIVYKQDGELVYALQRALIVRDQAQL